MESARRVLQANLRLGIKCSGYYDDDPSVNGKAFMQCGYLYSIPRPEHQNSGQSWRQDPGSPWTQNLYTCASSVAATVKEVQFSTNGSNSFEALKVINVRDKNYTTRNLPLWGIEKVDSRKYKFWDVYKFWGLVNRDAAENPDLQVLSASKIYLPASVRGVTLGAHVFDSFAAGAAFTAAWDSVYEWAASLSDINANSIPK